MAAGVAGEASAASAASSSAAASDVVKYVVTIDCQGKKESRTVSRAESSSFTISWRFLACCSVRTPTVRKRKACSQHLRADSLYSSWMKRDSGGRSNCRSTLSSFSPRNCTAANARR